MVAPCTCRGAEGAARAGGADTRHGGGIGRGPVTYKTAIRRWLCVRFWRCHCSRAVHASRTNSSSGSVHLRVITSTPVGYTASYDAEGQLIQWQNAPSAPTTTDAFAYDGGGQRVDQQRDYDRHDLRGRRGVEEVATSSGMTTTTTTTYTAASMRIAEAVGGPDRYFRLYNHERTHQAPGYQTPAQIYRVAS